MNYFFSGHSPRSFWAMQSQC